MAAPIVPHLGNSFRSLEDRLDQAENLARQGEGRARRAGTTDFSIGFFNAMGMLISSTNEIKEEVNWGRDGF